MGACRIARSPRQTARTHNAHPQPLYLRATGKDTPQVKRCMDVNKKYRRCVLEVGHLSEHEFVFLSPEERAQLPTPCTCSVEEYWYPHGPDCLAEKKIPRCELHFPLQHTRLDPGESCVAGSAGRTVITNVGDGPVWTNADRAATITKSGKRRTCGNDISQWEGRVWKHTSPFEPSNCEDFRIMEAHQ